MLLLKVSGLEVLLRTIHTRSNLSFYNLARDFPDVTLYPIVKTIGYSVLFVLDLFILYYLLYVLIK